MMARHDQSTRSRARPLTSMIGAAAKILAVSVALVALASCSPSSSTTGATNTEPSLNTLPPTSASSTTRPQPSPGVSAAPPADCTEAADIWDSIVQEQADVATGASQQTIDDLNLDLEDLKKVAPDGIRSAMDTWRTAAGQFVARYREIVGPSGNVDPSRVRDLQQAWLDMNTPDVKQAETDIGAFLSACRK